MRGRGGGQFLPVTLKSGGPKPANSVRKSCARSRSRFGLIRNEPRAAYWDVAGLRLDQQPVDHRAPGLRKHGKIDAEPHE